MSETHAAWESAPRKPSVIVVDADRRVRDGLVGLLECDGRIALAGSAAHVDEAMDLVAEAQPMAVVIDPRLPEVTDGIALIERLRADIAGLRVLVLAWSGAVERALGGDPLVAVVSASAGADDLVDRILDLLDTPAEAADADARIPRCA